MYSSLGVFTLVMRHPAVTRGGQFQQKHANNPRWFVFTRQRQRRRIRWAGRAPSLRGWAPR